MKSLALRLSVPVLSLLSIVSLSGCSGFDSATFPSASTNPEQVPVGPINGSVFGGHAPVVGAHIYLLQASTAGYGSAATSLLTAGSSATSSSFPVVVNASNPVIPAFTSYYHEVTDANGSFNLSGDYTCATGTGGADGPPVYIYAYGGTPNSSATSVNTSSSQVAITGRTNGTVNHATYTFTIPKPTTALTVGEIVSFSGFTVSGTSGASIAAGINNESSTVTAYTAGATTSTVAVLLPYSGPNSNNTYTVTAGTLSAQPNFNPAIVNLAVLGNCPASGNFAASVPFVYMNEVSTTAAAYALAGFATSGNALDISSSNTYTKGLLNAGANADQLYDIKGSVNGSGTQGEGHIARLSTPNGNGTVSQRLIDSIANSLAACVDSANTTAATSATCGTLFQYATSDGTDAGDEPADTASAAINMAHNPYSAAKLNGTPYATGIYNLGSVNSPFVPSLSSAPANFAVTISYTGGGLGLSPGLAPHSVAIDAAGDVWAVSASNALSEFSPLGVPLSATGFTGNGLSGPKSVAIDASSSNVWIANHTGNTVSRFTTAGVASSNFLPNGTLAAGTGLQDAAIDALGNIWVSEGTSNQIAELTSAGAFVSVVSGSTSAPNGLAVQSTAQGAGVWGPNAGQPWLSVSYQNPNNDGYYYGGGIAAGNGVASDSFGDMWTSTTGGSINANVIYESCFRGNCTTYLYIDNIPTGTTGGTAANPGTDGIAVDGADNVFATSPYSQTLFEIDDTGANHSGTAGYSLANAGGTAGSPDGIAIDGSGNVWFNTSTDSTLRELVGAAIPVVTPIAASVKNNTIATEPLIARRPSANTAPTTVHQKKGPSAQFTPVAPGSSQQ